MNPADIAVIGVLLLSALLAFGRGLVREALAVGSWVGAAFATLYGLPYARPQAREMIEQPLVADAVAGLAIFLVTLIVFTVIGHRISRSVRGSALNAIDRSLGFVFGLVRGAVLVCLAYLVVEWLVLPEEQPAWMAEARTRPAVAAGAGWLKTLVPDETRSEAAGQAEVARDQAQRVMEAGDALRQLTTPQLVSPNKPKGSMAPAPDPGYKDRDRGDLERLIQNNSSTR